MNLNKMVVRKLSVWKIKNGKTNEEIGKYLGVPGSMVSYYLSSRSQIPKSKFQQIANVMRISLDRLITDSDEKYKVYINGKITTISGQSISLMIQS